MVELVDAPDSKSGAARRVGSIPTGGTTTETGITPRFSSGIPDGVRTEGSTIFQKEKLDGAGVF